MEIEVKKNEKGDLICEMKEGFNAGTQVNINELMRCIGEDLTNGTLLQELGIIGTRYAIYAIESNYMSIIESDIVDNLRTIEKIFDSIAKNVTSANWYCEYRNLKEEIEKRIKEKEVEIIDLKLALEEANAQNQTLCKTIHRLENTEETE